MTATLLLLIAAKATLVLLAGWGLTRAMARTSAAARHLVWMLALGAALAVPVLHVAGPVWTLAVLPQATASSVELAAPVPLAAPFAEQSVEQVAATEAVSADVAAPSLAVSETASSDVQTWGAIAVRVWLVGVGLMLLRLAMGLLWAHVIVRSATDVLDTGWLDSLDEATGALGLTRTVGLRTSPRAAVPMATGLWRAVVLLPLSAIEWPEERRRVVLQHELAHVKRRDCLTQVLAQCVCALHWFNPAAHFAVSSVRAEQERACDDLVIEVGTNARSYADHLFEIARSVRAASFPSFVAMSMARPSQLEGRMVAILDEACVRCGPSGPMRMALLAGTVALVLPFGAMRLAAQSPAPDVQAATGVEQVSPDVAEAAEEERLGEPDSRESLSADAEPSVDVVHGSLDHVDLIQQTPTLHVDDVIRLGALGKSSERMAEMTVVAKVFKDTTREVKWLAAQGPSAQAGSAVSDETRKRVADALMSALNDESAQVRQEALSALAAMRDERAIPGLVRALSDPVAEVRMRALGALVQFNSAAAADGVMTALKDRNADVREQAARQLASLVSRGQLRDAKYVDAFATLMKDENADVREQAIVALGRLRATTASVPLTQALKDNSPDVRQQAARALGQLGSVDAVPALSALLKDPVKDVREQAANALGNLADPRAIDALTAALKDADPSVREEAARALGQIARGQRRGVRPGIPPAPPLPPLPPRAFNIDRDQIREMTERARELAEDARRDAERAMRDMRFFGPLTFPEPRPEAVPAPPALPAAPAPPR